MKDQKLSYVVRCITSSASDSLYNSIQNSVPVCRTYITMEMEV
jgi:hypothetical protein